MNHITPDGLLAVNQCERPIRYRDDTLIVQDSCTPEPRTELIIQRHGGLDNTALTLDVTRAHALMMALQAFLQNAAGTSAWMYGGVKYNLESAWEGRPGTPYEGQWFRYTDRFDHGVPIMKLITDDPSQWCYGAELSLPSVLGLKPCPDHGGYQSPCPQCVLAESDPAAWA